jgi:hypothetical protein
MFQYDCEFLTGKLDESIHGGSSLLRLAQSYGLQHVPMHGDGIAM